MAQRTGLIAAAVVIIVIIAIAAAITLQRGGKPAATTTAPPATAATTTTAAASSPAATAGQAKPSKPTLTGNIEEDIVAIGRYLAAQGIHKATFTVWGAGDPNSVMRTLAVAEAAYRLNKILEKNGVDFRIEVKQNFRRGGGDKLAEDFAAAFQSNANPDIMANSYKHIARFAEQGYLLDITPYLEKYKSLLGDFYPSLLAAVQYKGRYYGLPQDTEARPLYWRTDVAACIKEKTGNDILAGLAEKIERGEVTWHDIYRYAKLAVESGCSKWGVLHRKGSAHPDLIQFIYAFGGRLYDPEKNMLVLDVPAVYKWLYVEWRMARDHLLPEDMMSWDWAKQIHPAVVSGQTLVWIGGTWHWTEWQTKPYYLDPKTGEKRPLTTEEVKKYFYYTLFAAGDPGDKPVTLSQPFVWMIASNAGKDNPRYSELKDVYHMLAFLLVVKADDPDLVAIHSIISAHLPVRKAAAELIADKAWVEKLAKLQVDLSPEVKNSIADIVKATVNDINVAFLANASNMLKYTHLTPMHPDYPRLADIFASAVDKVLRGEMTPEEAVNYIISKIKADPELSKTVEIVGEIPRDWSFP
ncbi:ABC transporter substrate-binding protein [Pyrodictium occultum]|uniref:ABC transporter substrate-binding protein n=1 Tax=Pyrodictium occultum TaxID=2309 RepID=A0A0V8RRD9_PYROC|nr:extracellular solute-binding protein [Pyrodictium occultum]KSW10700.1 ABC transporter substrate-binding protein [Pyrodictium occultum]